MGGGGSFFLIKKNVIYFFIFWPHYTTCRILGPQPAVEVWSLFFFLINLFIYLFLVALGLRCCARAFSSCGEQGLLFVVVRGLLIAVASLVAELRL